MYRIERVGLLRHPRLVSDSPLATEDFDEIGRQLGQRPCVARKIAPVAARVSHTDELIITRFDGIETRNTAAPGDFIATLLDLVGAPLQDSQGNVNQYVIRPAKFEQTYERAEGHCRYGDIYRPRNVIPVEALHLSGGFDIMAPWGERQSGASGYLLRNGEDIYGNQSATFEATYQIDA